MRSDYLHNLVDPPCPAGAITYTIKPGDSFYTIAQRLGTTVAAITALNPRVNPYTLQVGQQICIPRISIPQQPVLIPTPFCTLLQPILSALPSTSDIPIGSVTVRQVAMSTRAYTIVASPLPAPSVFGNYDSYIGILNLITDNPDIPRASVNIRLIASSFGNQLTTWAGTIITTYPPIVGDFAEIRPFNSRTEESGRAIMGGSFKAC